MTRRLPLAALAMVVALAVSCTADSPPPIDPPTPAENASRAALLPRMTNDIPDLSVDGFHELLSQLRGTPVVVNFWGSWCGPCRTEAPILEAAAKTYGRQVQFIGIDLLDTRAGARGFMTEFLIPYPSFYDPHELIPTSLGYEAPPLTLFYDRTGKLVPGLVPFGPITAQALSTGIQKILG